MHPLYDPFVHFCVGCLLAPPLWLQMSPMDALQNYFADKYMIFFVALTFAVIWYVNHDPKKENRVLSSFENFRARWYLLNGTIIHMYLDGAVGGYQVSKIMAKQYEQLDKRYNDKTPYGSTLHVISVMELALYGPLCIWLYWAFYRGKAYRASLETLVCAFQLYGTLVYVMQEYVTGFKSFPWIDYKLEFTLNHCFYFWFAVVMGVGIWVVMPVWFIVVALGETQTVVSPVNAAFMSTTKFSHTTRDKSPRSRR